MDKRYNLVELTSEEAEALTKDIQEVLAKHNCELGVKAAIQLLKRVEIDENSKPIVSPYGTNDSDKTEESPDPSPESSS